MVDEQELHHALLRLDRLVAACVQHLHAVGRPAWRRPAAAWAPSRPRPGTCGSWPRSTASCDSRSAGRRCRACRRHASPCCLLAPRPSCRRFRCSTIVALAVIAAAVRRSAALVRASGRHECSACARSWYSNSSRKCLMKLCTGIAAASPSAQMVRPCDVVGDAIQQVEVLLRPCAVLDAVDHAVQPAGAFAARRALAAGFLVSRSTTGARSARTMQRASRP